MPNHLLNRIRIVLVSTSQRGNIGAAARALKTMGLSQLHLVTPRFDDALGHEEAIAFAANAADVLAAARIHATLDEALAGCSWAVAMTARNRDISVPEMDARDAVKRAIQIVSKMISNGNEERPFEIAFVFGSERYGLDNEDVMKCQACCTLPTNPSYTSLNLAQAVQIIAYECRLAALAHAANPAPDQSQAAVMQYATHEQREQFFTHLQEALIGLEFLNAEYPKKLMQRLRRMFARTELEQEEISILRGICTAILSKRGSKHQQD